MISLQPQENFAIVRHFPDPADASTLFVQAIVRNSITGATIATLNLVESGSNTHRFTKVWQVPADVSGLGFYIDITTFVYTDVGLTTKSTVYGEDNNSYLVWDREKMHRSGGGGSDVDYKKISKLLREVLTPFAEVDKKGNFIGLKIEKVDLKPVLKELQELKTICDAIEIPEIKEVEFKPITDALEGMKKAIVEAIDKKEVTDATNLEPVLNAISGLEGEIGAMVERVDGHKEDVDKILGEFKTLHDNFKSTFGEEFPDLNKNIDDLLSKMREAIAYSTTLQTGKKDNKNPRGRAGGLIP